MGPLIVFGVVVVVAFAVLMWGATRPERQEKRMRHDPDREPSLFAPDSMPGRLTAELIAREPKPAPAPPPKPCGVIELEVRCGSSDEVMRIMGELKAFLDAQRGRLNWSARDLLPLEGSDLED